MGLTTDMLKKIKEEILSDPDNMGYAGKTDIQIANLLSSSPIKSYTNYEVCISPLNKILANLSNSPNIISSTEVSQAKLL